MLKKRVEKFDFSGTPYYISSRLNVKGEPT